MVGRYTLPSGLKCQVLAPPMPGVPNYHVLAAETSARDHDLEQLAQLATRLARELGIRLHGDEAAFTVILKGARTSRRPWAHAHIIPAGTPAQKRRAFACLFLKDPLRRLSRNPRRPGTAAPA